MQAIGSWKIQFLFAVIILQWRRHTTDHILYIFITRHSILQLFACAILLIARSSLFVGYFPIRNETNSYRIYVELFVISYMVY